MSLRKRLNRILFDRLPLRPAGRAIYNMRRRNQKRAQSCATMFFRNPVQLAAFKGPLATLRSKPYLRILVAACSIGCEAYSIAGYLAHFFPNLDFHVDACDISEDAIAFALAGVYDAEHIGGPFCPETEHVLRETLIPLESGRWRVKDAIRSRVSFEVTDILSSRFGRHRDYHCVFGQNFLVHMNSTDAEQALAALVDAARPGGALFLGGMDLDARHALAAAHRLVPLDWEIPAIHDADRMRREDWPWHYWSLEPLDRGAMTYPSRYATIFLKPETSRRASPAQPETASHPA